MYVSLSRRRTARFFENSWSNFTFSEAHFMIPVVASGLTTSSFAELPGVVRGLTIPVCKGEHVTGLPAIGPCWSAFWSKGFYLVEWGLLLIVVWIRIIFGETKAFGDQIDLLQIMESTVLEYYTVVFCSLPCWYFLPWYTSLATRVSMAYCVLVFLHLWLALVVSSPC